jgi:hypothetical protein
MSVARMAGLVACILGASLASTAFAQSASSLYLYPSNGLFTIGTPFTVEVRLDTGGQTVNAAEGSLTFDPVELQVTSVSAENSVFTMWVIEPEFDNIKGEIRFSGGTQQGFSGAAGTLVSITFTPLRNAASEVWFSQGAAVLAADGAGSNILSRMHTGTYTLGAREVVASLGEVTYAAEATPGDIASPTHPDDNRWYATSTAILEWVLPADATGMRTGLSENPNTPPGTLHGTLVSSRTIEDIADGIWYFSLQMRNADGWGEEVRKTLRIDTSVPRTLEVAEVAREDPTDPRLSFEVVGFDLPSGIERYEFSIDGGSIEKWSSTDGDSTYEPKGVVPGNHILSVAAYDYAGNSTSTSVSFTLGALESPVIQNPPTHIMVGEELTVRGASYPNTDVTAVFSRDDGEEERKTVRTGADGSFAVTLAELARSGTYRARFTVTDERGATSLPTETIEIVASQPKIVLFGTVAVSYLSVIVPLIGLLFLGGYLLYFLWQHLRTFRTRVKEEVTEAQESVHDGFAWLRSDLKRQISDLKRAGASRELTKEEIAMLTRFQRQLDSLEKVVSKEVNDIEMITDLRRR